jgi:hypothetical protein
MEEITQTEVRLAEPIISHPVKKHVREAVGIPEGEPAALVVHITREQMAYDITQEGLVNVSGRGTLASILDNPDSGEPAGVPSIVVGHTERYSAETTIITFCVPAGALRRDTRGNYGMWFDNRLMPGEHPKLWEIYNQIAIEYDENTGKPTKFAKDDPSLYPVFVPKEYILGVATTSKPAARGVDKAPAMGR